MSTKPKKVHLCLLSIREDRPDLIAKTLCNNLSNSFTNDHEEVTCISCLRRLNSLRKRLAKAKDYSESNRT